MSGVNKSEMYKELEGKSNRDVANKLRSTESREERCEVMSMFISLRKEETGLVGKSDDEARMLLEQMKAKSREALMRNLELSIYEEDKNRKRLKPHVQVERILEEIRDGCPSLQLRLMNAHSADKSACQKANETPDKRRTRLEGDAARKANARTNETAEERRTRLERDAARKANARTRERAKISDRQPTYDTKVWESPGKDFTLKGHEQDATTALILFHSKSGNPAEPVYLKLVAYVHVINRLRDREDMCAVAKLVDLSGLSLERRECLIKTIYKVIPDEIYERECLEWEQQTDQRRWMDRHESELLWFATTDVVSLDESRTTISIPWIQTLIGLQLIVPGRWWNRCKKKDKSKLWRCEIDSINDTDKEEKYFGIKCLGDGRRYWVKYETIEQFVDTGHVDYPKYDLPKKQPFINQEFNDRCEQTLRRLKDPNASLSSKVDICVGHCERAVGRFIASHGISPEEAALLISRYCAAQGRALPWGAKKSFPWSGSTTLSAAPLVTCASCGVRSFYIDNSDTKDDESDNDVIERMGLRDEAFSSTRRTYEEVDVKKLKDYLRLREGDQDIETEDIDMEESDDSECKLTGPRSRRTQGYHRRLMEREPLCIPCNNDGDTKEVELWRLKSVWPAKKPDELKDERDKLPDYIFDNEGNPVYLHLHPEFVREKIVPGEKNEYYATMCSHCKKSLDASKPMSPWRSLVSGVDFGDGNRIGLEPLTERERQIISKHRHYLLVIKIESNTADGERVIERGQSAVKGCGIFFNHDSPRVVSDLLSKDSINGDVSLQFVGPEGEYDSLAAKVMGSSNVEGRAWVIYQWLKVLQEVNCHYQYDDKLPEFEQVKGILNDANKSLVDDADRINDDSVVRETEIAKDDARHIRTHGGVGNDVDDMEVEELGGGSVDFPLRCSFITHTKAGSGKDSDGKDSDRDYLESAAEALGVDAKEFATTLSRREGTPLNEYEHGDGILAKASPDVCIFGTAYNSSRPTLDKYQTEHLIMQYTTNAACNRQLLCQLFESNRRHGVIANMHAKATSNPKEFEKFADEFSSSEFQAKLKASVQNPDGSDAKYVLNKVTPLLTFAGRKSAFGALERNQSAGEMLALGRRYGCAPVFLTFGIDDINHPNAIRLALRSSSNNDFPAVVSSASHVEMDCGIPLEDKHEGVVHIPHGYTERLKHMNNNPIGAALAYKQVVHDIMEILIGIKPSMYSGDNDKTLKTGINCARNGLVGPPRAFFGKNETTHSGSLHFHVIIWAGLSPQFIEFVSDIPRLCKDISEMLESQYCAELDRHVHVKDLVHMNIKTVRGLKKLREKKLRDLKQSGCSDICVMESPTNVNHLDKSVDCTIESTSSIEGVPDAPDNDVSIAAPPKIHRLLSFDSEKGNSEEEESSSLDTSDPRAFAKYGKTLLKNRCIDGCCVDDHCTQANTDQTSQKYPGINVVTPTKPIISFMDSLKMKGGDSIGNTSRNVSSSRPRPSGSQLPPHPSKDEGSFKSFAGVTICHCGIHIHTFTCKKPPKGWHGCRLCFSKPLSNMTRPIELASSLQPNGTTQWDELYPYGTEYVKEKSDGSTEKGEQEYVRDPDWDPDCDPDRYTVKEDIYPLKSDSSRTIVWELNRPKLKGLDELDDGMTKEGIISRLCEEMAPIEKNADGSVRSFVFKDASSRLAMEQVDLHCFNKDDKNNLFYTLLLGMIQSCRLKAGKKSVQCIRRELMHHLNTKLHNYKFDESDESSTVARYIESRMDASDDAEDTIEQYARYMRNVTGNNCFEGGELEIRLFAEKEKLNVAIYEEEIDSGGNGNNNGSYKRAEFFGTDGNDRTTIHLRRELNNDGGNSRRNQGIDVTPPEYHYTLMTSKLQGVMDSLQAFDLHDLKILYALVSKNLPERNGLVVEFNPYLTSLLGCNSNLLYLGSTEQSKAALFYIGPYINKDGVKITDALPILMKAQEDTIKYPSVADDRDTAKRRAQHTLSRALNKLNGLIEVSDTQIGASLLQMSASLCSDSFVVCNTKAYRQFVDAELRRTNESNGIRGVGASGVCGGLEEEMENNMLYHEDGNGEDIGDVNGSATACAHYNSTEDIIGEDESESATMMNLDDSGDDTRHRITQSQNEEDEDDQIQNGQDGEDSAYINASFGAAPFYKTNDGSKQPVSYAALYRYRGEGLKHFSRYEYCALVKVAESKDDPVSSPSTSSGRGRRKSEVYPFELGLGIENNYHQVLRSKQLTPKFTSNPPPPPKHKPRPPDLDQFDEAGEYEDCVSKYEHELDNLRKKADKFAHFYLTMFRPEDTLYKRGHVCKYKYDYEAFVEFYRRLRVGSRSCFIHSKRLALIDSMVCSWRVDREKREMLAAHRGRARTMWSAEEKEASKVFFGGNLKPLVSDDGMDYISDVVHELTSKEMTDARKHLGHSNAILSTLGSLAKPLDGSTSTNVQSNSSAPIYPRAVANVTTLPFNMDLDESKRQSEFKDTYIDNDANATCTPNAFRAIPDLDKKVKDYIKAQDLSADKDIVINIAHDHFKAIRSGKALEDDYEAPNLLVCGKPGNGKSKIIETLDGIVQIMKVGEQIKNAFLGSAAINIRGTTLLKSWNIPVFSEGQRVTFRPWNEDSLQALKRRFGHNVDNICAVVIDEVSTVQPYMLAYLNIRMQELFGNSKLFGGRMVILLGDFQQKPPTAGGKGNSLPGVVMKHIEEEGQPLTLKSAEKLGLAQTGGYLFSKFRYIKLTSQHRSGDPKHMAVLNKMSETGIVTVEDLKSTYKKLSREDMESDDFRFATNIVTGNAERREINAWQAKRWAKHHGVNTVRWPRKRAEASWKGRPRTEECVAHAMQNSCFWEFYIPGAMGYLNTYSINSISGLANGTEIKYHSLSFEDKEQRKQFKSKCAQAKPGDIITIESPPTAINVELFADFGWDSTSETAKKKRERKEWLRSGKGSITRDGRVVIPISLRDGSKIQSKKAYVSGCTRLDMRQYYYHDSSLMIKDWFPIEPAFSITVDKAQGKTIHRIILSISKHSFHLNKIKWEDLYVSLSRVREGDHMRLLINGGDWGTVSYVSELRRDKYVHWYFGGYKLHPDGDGSMIWDYNLARKKAGLDKKRKIGQKKGTGRKRQNK